MTAVPQRSSEPLVVLHRDLSTANQVQALLAIGGAMMDFLSEKPKDAENIPGSRPLPGESRHSAETTLIKVCSRLDQIVEDSRRWGIDFQLALEKLYLESSKRSEILAEKQTQLMEAELQRAEAQKTAALEVQSPHFRYKPTLFSLKDGGWAAFLGDPNDLDHGIVGVGANPADALRAFDLVFSGKLTAEQQKIVETAKLNENDSLDKTGIEIADGTGGSGDPAPSGGGDSGPQL